MSEQFMEAIVQGNLEEVSRLLQSGSDPNVIFDDVPALYYAILEGRISIVRLLLESGADPNFVADEPIATVYDEKPLLLAMAARNMMNWDQFQPMVKLLESFGATDTEGRVESVAEFQNREQVFKPFQARRDAELLH